MQDDPLPRLAILGAGPIGLEAALYARYLGYPAEILERAAEPAINVIGDDPLGTFAELASTLGVAALKAQDPSWHPPSATEPLTGRRWRERYLLPLAGSDLIADILKMNTEVIAITRRDEADDTSFQIRCRNAEGHESTLEADIVVDATGAVGTREWFTDEPVDPNLGFENPDADYYVIGEKSRTEVPFRFAMGLTQIRDLFAILGDRDDLDVYATLPPW